MRYDIRVLHTNLRNLSSDRNGLWYPFRFKILLTLVYNLEADDSPFLDDKKISIQWSLRLTFSKRRKAILAILFFVAIFGPLLRSMLGLPFPHRTGSYYSMRDFLGVSAW